MGLTHNTGIALLGLSIANISGHDTVLNISGKESSE